MSGQPNIPGVPAARLAPGSMVFTPTRGPVDLRDLSQWRAWTPGASRRRPEGPGSGLRGRTRLPVVHVAHEDALAYAACAAATAQPRAAPGPSIPA